MTEKERLMHLHDQICKSAKELLKIKNADYAAGDDPYFNFRMFGREGILVRLGDKLMRLRALLINGKFEVSSETLLDTVKDIVNYAVLFHAYRDIPIKGIGQETLVPNSLFPAGDGMSLQKCCTCNGELDPSGLCPNPACFNVKFYIEKNSAS